MQPSKYEVSTKVNMGIIKETQKFSKIGTKNQKEARSHRDIFLVKEGVEMIDRTYNK